MPKADRGHLLRAVNGVLGSRLSATGPFDVLVPLFNYGGLSGGPALMGTRFFNAASGLVDFVAPGGRLELEGTQDEYHYISLQPAVPWGKRGRLARYPRSVVLIVPDYHSPDDLDFGQFRFAKRIVEAVVAAEFESAGVQVLIVRADFSHVAMIQPLLAPLVLADAAVSITPSDPNLGGGGEQHRVVAQVDARACIGGDVWYGWVGGYDGSFGSYTKSGFAPTQFPNPYPWSNTEDYTLFAELIFPVSIGAPTVHYIQYGWDTPFLADGVLLGAAAERCRSFRFTWINYTGNTIVPGVTPSGLDTFVGRLPAAVNASLLRYGDGDSAGAAVVAQIRDQFGL